MQSLAKGKYNFGGGKKQARACYFVLGYPRHLPEAAPLIWRKYERTGRMA